MKKLLLPVMLIVCGSLQSKEIPSPFWFSISEKILSETHQLINPEAKESLSKAGKQKTVKAAKAKINLKCQKQELFLPNPMTMLSNSGIWMFDDVN
ncbi:MAG TPA: hypothetical protein VGB50_10065 [Flavobacterium sp.]